MSRKQIRSVDPISAGKVGCIWGLILATVFGCFTVFLPMMVMPSFLAAMMPEQQDALQVMGGGFLASLFTYLVFIVLQGVTTALLGLLGALFYNLVARLVGGVVVHLEDESAGI